MSKQWQRIHVRAMRATPASRITPKRHHEAEVMHKEKVRVKRANQIEAPQDALYESVCAMDNQDVPAEEWPAKLIEALARAGYAVVPVALAPRARVKRINQEVRELPIPARASAGAAGFDLRSSIPYDRIIVPGEVLLVPTGWIWEIPHGYVGKIYIRSSWAGRGLALANHVGIVDPDYRGEVNVMLKNVGDDIRKIHFGDRIAQMLIEPVRLPDLVECEELSATERGAGGFGSTGVGG